MSNRSQDRGGSQRKSVLPGRDGPATGERGRVSICTPTKTTSWSSEKRTDAEEKGEVTLASGGGGGGSSHQILTPPFSLKDELGLDWEHFWVPLWWGSPPPHLGRKPHLGFWKGEPCFLWFPPVPLGSCKKSKKKRGDRLRAGRGGTPFPNLQGEVRCGAEKEGEAHSIFRLYGEVKEKRSVLPGPGKKKKNPFTYS